MAIMPGAMALITWHEGEGAQPHMPLRTKSRSGAKQSPWKLSRLHRRPQTEPRLPPKQGKGARPTCSVSHCVLWI